MAQRRRPQQRQRKARGRSRVGETYTLEIGPVAHGGACVARIPADDGPGRVVFVRHALPGEVVEVQITEGTDGDTFWRGDAVEVQTASPDRVTAPCPVAGPGLCGGCDLQHVALSAQRPWKAAVVQEQLQRLAKLEVDVEVEAVPGDIDGLRWRTRTRFARTPDGRPGLRRYRSHEVIPVEDCLISIPGHPVPISEAPVVETVTAAGRTHEFTRAGDGFWQVHPGAPTALVEAVLEFLDPQPGERVLDLYAGVGLFARFLADRVGEDTRLVAVEGDRAAAGHARDNLSGLRWAEVGTGDVATVLDRSFDEPFDLVVLDPPREGARRAVVEQVAARAPRAVAYVACDPAALARDVALFAEQGYRMTGLRAFDLFPMTHHVECVALLTKPSPDLR